MPQRWPGRKKVPIKRNGIAVDETIYLRSPCFGIVLRKIPMNFRRLDVYQTAIRFLPLSSEIADQLPPRYAVMADQLRRAALSIPLNIAEGSGKTSGPDQRRFYSIARGSAMECAAIMDACASLLLIDKSQMQQADQLLTSAVQMLSKLCRP